VRVNGLDSVGYNGAWDDISIYQPNGIYGYKADFDSSNDEKIIVNNSDSFNGVYNISVSGWFVINNDSDERPLIEIMNASDDSISIVYDEFRDTIVFYDNINGADTHYYSIDSNDDMDMSTWYMVSLTINQYGGFSIYINDDIVYEGDCTPFYLLGNNLTINIGFSDDWDYGNRYHHGYIDDLKIFNQTLTNHEIERLYELGSNGYYQNNIFSYFTSPVFDDTDNDGQVDGNDLIPIDYDMDGDGLLNNLSLVDTFNPNRLDNTIISRIGPSGSIGYQFSLSVDDNDTDDDGILDRNDTDADNDGMNDIFEGLYGKNNTIKTDGVEYSGWQNPYVHNSRYAILIIGGSSNPTDDHSSFWRDQYYCYDLLSQSSPNNGYNFLEENIFFTGSQYYATSEYPFGLEEYIDAESAFMSSKFDIQNTISLIGSKSTKNDLIFFSYHGHGTAQLYLYDPDFNGSPPYVPINGVAIKDNSPFNDNTLEDQLRVHFGGLNPYDKKYSRLVVLIVACGSGIALESLKGYDRIIITNTKDGSEGSWDWAKGGSDTHKHNAFYYKSWYQEFNSNHQPVDRYKPGFLLTLDGLNNEGSFEFPVKLSSAYEAGRSSANYWNGLHNNDVNDKTSTPCINDYANLNVHTIQSAKRLSEVTYLGDNE